MTNNKKSYFEEKTPYQIRRLNLTRTSNPRGLVQRIDNLDPTADAIEIRTRIIPGRFYRNGRTGAQASKKCYKHGDLIILSQPRSQQEALQSSEIPLQMRYRDFQQLQRMKEEEIEFVGYSTKPVQGVDRTRAIFNFRELTEGARIYSYAEQRTWYNLPTGEARSGIQIQFYPDAKRVKQEGAAGVVNVPSRTKKKPRYKFQLKHIPYDRSSHNLATVLSLTASDLKEERTEEPIRGRSPWQNYDIRYTWATIREGSHIKRWDNHQIAAYLAAIKETREQHNHTTLEMNPFALPSQHQKDFYLKLCNNVLIFDPSLDSKEKTRKLHLAEKSILLARAIGVFGHNDFAYWNPERDGSMRAYDWTIPT